MIYGFKGKWGTGEVKENTRDQICEGANLAKAKDAKSGV